MTDYWQYRARLVDVVDGDTVDLEVDLGFRTHKQVRVRIAGIDTKEIFFTERDEDYDTGIEQKEFVEDYLDADGEWPLEFISHEESGKYGRWIGDIAAPDTEQTLSEAILAEWPDAKYE